MAAARSAMLVSGAALAGMATVAGLFRAVGLMDEKKVSPEVFWAVLFGMLVVGVMLLVFAPPSRQTERRVELGPPQSVSHSTRPKVAGSNGNGSTGTRASTARSASSSSPRRTAPKAKAKAKAGGNGGPHPGPARSAATGSQGGNGDHTAGPMPAPDVPSADEQPAPPDGPLPPSVAARHHPNDSAKADDPVQEPGAQPSVDDHEAAPPSLRARSSSKNDDSGTFPMDPGHEMGDPQGPSASGRLQQQMERSRPPSLAPMRNDLPSPGEAGPAEAPPVADADHRVRFERRREELETRLESLDQRLNQAKVSMGLGRISHAGYRQYVKEVERERTLIESELMTIRGDA